MSRTIFETSKQIKAKLSKVYASSEIESFIFMIYDAVLEYSSAKVLAFPEHELNAGQQISIDDIVNRLAKAEPIQYVLGESAFYDLTFKVSPGVLIPRPETEELVHWILNDYALASIHLIDIGTGSGVIPITLAKNRPQWKVSGLDVSEIALNMARHNAVLNEVKVDFTLTDILNDSIPGSVDYNIIVSNPPYVTHSEKLLMEQNVLSHEPHLALFVEDQSPLVFYERIAILARERLCSGGCLYFEINEQFGEKTLAMLKSEGFQNIELRKDLNGKDRMVKALKL